MMKMMPEWLCATCILSAFLAGFVTGWAWKGLREIRRGRRQVSVDDLDIKAELPREAYLRQKKGRTE
jgi:hypothetical protein